MGVERPLHIALQLSAHTPVHPQPCHATPTAPHSPAPQTPQTAGGSEFVPGELDAVGELEEGGEFDPDDLEEEGEAPVVEESAGAAGWCGAQQAYLKQEGLAGVGL